MNQENKTKNITEEEVLKAINNNLEKNEKITREFEQEIFNKTKEEILNLEKIKMENVWNETNK